MIWLKKYESQSYVSCVVRNFVVVELSGADENIRRGSWGAVEKFDGLSHFGHDQVH